MTTIRMFVLGTGVNRRKRNETELRQVRSDTSGLAKTARRQAAGDPFAPQHSVAHPFPSDRPLGRTGGLPT